MNNTKHRATLACTSQLCIDTRLSALKRDTGDGTVLLCVTDCVFGDELQFTEAELELCVQLAKHGLNPFRITDPSTRSLFKSGWRAPENLAKLSALATTVNAKYLICLQYDSEDHSYGRGAGFIYGFQQGAKVASWEFRQGAVDDSTTGQILSQICLAPPIIAKDPTDKYVESTATDTSADEEPSGDASEEK